MHFFTTKGVLVCFGFYLIGKAQFKITQVYLYSARCGGGSFKRQSNVTTAKRKEKTPQHYKEHHVISNDTTTLQKNTC
jgi:hypothetical protein